jgi:hypothetical protein
MAAKPKAETVTVYATCNLHENGTFLKKGDSLEVTPERAAALGECVTDKSPE